MSEREIPPGESADEQLVRAHLSELVDDVRPAPGSLARVLAGSRRGRGPWRPALAGTGAVVAAVASFLAVVVLSSAPSGPEPRPVGTGTDSYITQTRGGVLARVDLRSGREAGKIAELPGRVMSLAADGERVYAAVSGERQRIYELVAGRAPEVVTAVEGDASLTDLTAAHGRIAYLHDGDVVVRAGPEERTMPAPDGAVGLALAPSGRPVVLTESRGGKRSAALRIADPESSGWTRVRTGTGCAPLAVAPVETGIAVLYRVDCRADGAVRVAALDPATGRRRSAGTPFDAGSGLRRGHVQLSAGPLGRYLVTAPSGGRWLVDGAQVRALPDPCGSGAGCAGTPSAL